jgi:hypothetical protein
MERENRSNGNQEESKEGRKEETLRAFNQSKTGGREKRPLSFCAQDSVGRPAGRDLLCNLKQR